jgi:hypothetical protein
MMNRLAVAMCYSGMMIMLDIEDQVAKVDDCGSPYEALLWVQKEEEQEEFVKNQYDPSSIVGRATTLLGLHPRPFASRNYCTQEVVRHRNPPK